MTAELAAEQLISVEEYLAWEAGQPDKHEYVAGVIYAMAGGKNRHNLIASNVQGALYAQLRGRRCRVYNSDTKVKVMPPTHTRFYYPDAMVVCQPSAMEQAFQDWPAVIVEVISETTRRTDEQEKREAYLALGGLQVYLLVEQASASVVVWRRADQGFRREVFSGIDAVIELPEIGGRLALAEAYEAVTHGHDPADAGVSE